MYRFLIFASLLTSKLPKTFLFLFSNQTQVDRNGIHEMFVRMANWEDPGQAASPEPVLVFVSSQLQWWFRSRWFTFCTMTVYGVLIPIWLWSQRSRSNIRILTLYSSKCERFNHSCRVDGGCTYLADWLPMVCWRQQRFRINFDLGWIFKGHGQNCL